ncbi:HPF/RaiA family ribosome-associated protein [Candidatus Woesearchaeota archaeon]|nr:HPF/RaiA family ribosome-associated protein [Candidatus Woesearchaeota archaeon]
MGPEPNIQLAGFKGIESSAMSILNRNIRNHLRRIAELSKNNYSIHLTLKRVHEREKSEKYEIHAKVTDGGKVYASKVTDRNLLAAVDRALEKITNEMD